ncbi:uncharacterized protein BDZ99DRAFT_516674 [Mytilinidion resinicola]|uniref:C2H2-type domain-containing protein n=1 Tax=Mytilinidion resinicola TaxID=574789 RepID=A0A6A6Z026_9PEZI|nr:uncharacterized protein BDZ99DRAFT_516674 [Mytilinidion resinicola]KAF2814053.1 hypothetical protein BDZ99DRAFT_516674 [Mytilinidion resinicola]
MTPRSPKSNKSTTISRRLRSRASQHLSIQPPELPQIRNLRSRRAATAAASSRNPPAGQLSAISVTSRPEPHHEAAWDPPELPQSFQRVRTSHSTVYEPHLESHSNSLLSQPIDSYSSEQLPPPTLSSYNTEARQYHIQASPAPDLPSLQLSQFSEHPTSGEFDLRLAAGPGLQSNQQVDLQNMSAIDFMVPSHYGSMDQYGSSAPLDSHSYQMRQQSQSSAGYAPAYVSSPPLRSQSGRSEAGMPPYQSTSIPRSPYQQPLGPMRGSPTPMSYPPGSSDSSAIIGTPPAHSYGYPAMQPTLPNQPISSLGNHGSSYPPADAYPPTSYEMAYGSLPTTMYPPSATPAYSYDHMAQPNPAAGGLSSSPEQRNVRVLNQRPKPQCWEHGCNGRQFSTFSNLLRHQREKSGTAAKSYCPRCGAEFTRTTARNGHMAHEKCKSRRPSDASQ